MLNPKIIDQYKNKTTDAASAMPDIRGKNILMGFWHNWPSEPDQGYQQGLFKEMALTDIPEAYNVVAVAFMKGAGIPTFKPYNLSDDAFRAQVAALNAQGRAVLISLGGADAHIELHAGQEDALAYEIIRLVETYGFDGLDIDLEQAAITFADNQTVLPAALRMVREYYETEGKHFIISMAPEFPYLRVSKKLPLLKEITTYFPFLKDVVTFLESLRSGGAYLAYINALEDIYDFIAPQYYNQGGDGLWVDEANNGSGLWVTQNNDAHKKDFLYYLTDSLIHGTRGFTTIPADRLAIGLPTNNDAAATGYVVNPQDAIDALDDLRKAGNPIRGLMTWSVNWDAGKNKSGEEYNWEFVNRYGYLTGGETPVPEKPSVPADLRSTEKTATSVKLNWSLSEGPQPVLQYELRRNGADSFLVDNPVYNNTGLQPGTAYSYQVRAIDVIGNTSEFSAALTVRTQSEGGGDAKPTTPVLSLADVTQSSVSLTWTPSTSDSQIVRYQIGRNGWPFQTIASVTTAYTDSDVTADTQYEYYVVAQDTELQWSEVSNVLKVKTAGETPAPGNPSLPLDFKSTEQTTTSVTLDWSKAKVAHVQYDLFRDNVFLQRVGSAPFTDTSVLHSRLYGYQIQAIDSVGNSSERSETLLVTTKSEPSDDRPTPPGNLRQTAATMTSVSLEWDASFSALGVASYRLITFGGETVSLDATTLKYTVEGLTAAKTYQCLAGALDTEKNLSGPSNVVQASTSAAIPEWKTAQSYLEGDKVTYGGDTYICLNPHTSQIDWKPGSAPTLWALWVEQAGGKLYPGLPKKWQ
ncbi:MULTISPECIES: fibronectin type III domain-containing protein [Pseudomonas syringae group]|uniref:Chitinase n=5 Tax=Pseudomonas syringae group TaxID=136849 RepID=A0A2K4WNQ6_PSESX|nr:MULTISPECIES: fibronectin type III domain-containing protein [Pseudomonas syringae group]AVB16923.1 chitinase [Pseudomonas amygdali pv. morsprunorum]KPB21092.1 Chitinase [Pseudomonas savastanoi]KPW74571.1 Glycosyl hydrolase family protein [Pseudomonas amygdali pv. ciccaronei]KPY75625.1 Glycosyl hydrolase family protein [Pseudomonas savastanoi pv. savastanoi]KWS51478.1 chitinase [Pseudomonas savastanoi pv. nerii]